MKFKKKLFKHGGSQAVVIPSELVKYFPTHNVVIRFQMSEDNNPVITIHPSTEPDTIEKDPLFAVFMEALYKHAMENPDMLSDGSEIYNDEVKKLLEGVDDDEEE